MPKQGSGNCFIKQYNDYYLSLYIIISFISTTSSMAQDNTGTQECTEAVLMEMYSEGEGNKLNVLTEKKHY